MSVSSDCTGIDECGIWLNPPWENNFKKQLTRLNKEIEQEIRYINEIHYTCASHFEIYVGLSVVRDFQPAVKLLNTITNQNISFDKYYWNRFLIMLKRCFVDDKESEAGCIKEDESDFRIEYEEFRDTKLFKVTNNLEVSLYIEKETATEILKLERIIDYRLGILNEMDFYNFYYNTLIQIKSCNRSIDYIFGLVTSKPNVLQMYCLFECLIYYREKICKYLSE